MGPAGSRFQNEVQGRAGGTPAVRMRTINESWSAGVPPAFDRTAPGGVAIGRSRGYLPHLDMANFVQHIVFRLADSLPGEISKDIASLQRDDRVAAFDAALDAGHGKRDLASPEIATLVQTALLAFVTAADMP